MRIGGTGRPVSGPYGNTVRCLKVRMKIDGRVAGDGDPYSGLRGMAANGGRAGLEPAPTRNLKDLPFKRNNPK